MVDLAGVDQLAVLASAEVDTARLPPSSEAGDGQGLLPAQVFFTQLLPRPLR